MYNSNIRSLALGIILVQIATQQTAQLVEAVRRWVRTAEIRLFISELMLSLYPWLIQYVLNCPH